MPLLRSNHAGHSRPDRACLARFTRKTDVLIDYTRREFGFALFSTTLATGLPPVSMAGTKDNVRNIEHQLGSTEISGRPSRVIALEFSFVQALDSLNIGPIGISDDNEPKRVEQLLARKIDFVSVGTRLEPNLELISTLAPDLIIADEVRHAAIYSQLSALAPTIVLNSWEGDYKTIKNSVVTIAQALGEKSEGERVIADHGARFAAMVARIPIDEQRRILLAVATPDNMSLHTSSSFSGSVFQAMGLTPAVESSKAIESGAGLERLIAVNPDILFVAADPGGTVFDHWRDNGAWKGISAARTSAVFEVDRNRFARFRSLKTAEMIASGVLDNIYNPK
jgi:ABC-type Fe3+-citrate transport system substrate-binding protein